MGTFLKELFLSYLYLFNIHLCVLNLPLRWNEAVSKLREPLHQEPIQTPLAGNKKNNFNDICLDVKTCNLKTH